MEYRIYKRKDCVIFRKTKEQFGGLSNMAAGFPIVLNGVKILTSEAIYQACRYPQSQEIQRLIIEQKSPMTAKMKSKMYLAETRDDWDYVNTRIMRWVLGIKLAQNWDSFGNLLLSTGDKPIVEESMRDKFWGAKSINDEELEGANILGRLLMEIREKLRSSDYLQLLIVNPPNIPRFFLYGMVIDKYEASDSQKPLVGSPQNKVNLINGCLFEGFKD